MLDNLRDEASQSPLFQETPPEEEAYAHGPGPRFLGMTAVQRFILALMLFLMTCVTGAFFLMITGKVVPAFF